MKRLKKLMHRVKSAVGDVVWMAVTLVSPKLNTQLRYFLHYGKFLDLQKPVTFSEKLCWLKLNRYANDPLVKRCADKYLVRDYVEQHGLGYMLNELIAVYASPKDIRWDELPQSFVLKWNFGCELNILCRDKSALDTCETTRKLRRWEKIPFWLKYGEYQYKTKEKRILCERFLQTDDGIDLLDYKFYCFNGKVHAVLIIDRPEDDEKAAVFMSPQWERISDVPGRYSRMLLPKKPACLNEMIEAAQRLAQPFPFVRVDFYEYKGNPIFGEMTFTPKTGLFPSETIINGQTMGELLQLDVRG